MAIGARRPDGMNKGKGLDMYLCVLSSIPDANDVPYDPSPHMNGYKWKHYQVNPEKVER